MCSLKYLFIQSFSMLLMFTSCSNQLSDFEVVESITRKEVLKKADKYVDYKPVTVTASISERSAGTQHDFYSEPHLLYAQAIKGKVTGRGIGIIDTIHLIEVSLAVKVIGDSGVYNTLEIKPIKAWFSQYLKWITTHKYGIKERDNGNNHSTCWAMQVAAFATLVDHKEQMLYCKNMLKNTLLPEQMAINGSFPKELARTKPYGYSIFNLDAMVGLAQLLSTEEDNLFTYQTKDGKSLKQGVQFLYPYLHDKNTWSFKKDVMYWEDWPTKQTALLFAGLNFNNNAYLETWKTLPEIPNKAEIIRNMPIRYPLLWIKP